MQEKRRLADSSLLLLRRTLGIIQNKPGKVVLYFVSVSTFGPLSGFRVPSCRPQKCRIVYISLLQTDRNKLRP